MTILSSFLLFAPLQWLLLRMVPRLSYVLPRLFYVIVLWLVKIRVKVRGRRSGDVPAPDHDDLGSDRSKIMNVIDSYNSERDLREKPASTFSLPALVVTNHISWTDILALGALFPAAFVAKSEVGRWPIIRTFAALVNTIFVDRTARRTIPATNAAMLAAIAKGAHVVLFPEATTHADGPHLFHSAHFAIVDDLRKAGQNYAIQPIAIRYSAPYAPWIGDDALLPHVITLMKNPPLTCELIFCEPILLSAPLTRRVVAQECFDRIVAAYNS